MIWEIEPGAMVLETATLPHPRVDRFDDPERLDAFLDAVRWGAITSADSRALQAPFRSGITIEDYQLDPVVRALQMPRVNLLIADDVGLGKTIEAGLVVQELLLRHRARTVLVVCPASLTLKWKSEMADRFGLEFRIVDAAMLRELRRERGLAANPFKSFPRLIVSIDWLKRPKAMSLLRDVLPPDAHVYPRRFDLLIVDEVHTCAPAGPRPLRPRLAAHRSDPHHQPALRAPAVPFRDAAQRLHRVVHRAARAARPTALCSRRAPASRLARPRPRPPVEVRAARRARPQPRRHPPIRQAGRRPNRGSLPRGRAGRSPKAVPLRRAAEQARWLEHGTDRGRVRHAAAQEAPVLVAGGVCAHARRPPPHRGSRRRPGGGRQREGGARACIRTPRRGRRARVGTDRGDRGCARHCGPVRRCPRR